MSETKKKIEPKKNWIERVAEKFGYKKDSTPKKDFEITSLADGSVRTYKDRKLEERIEAIEVLIYAMTRPIAETYAPKVKVKMLKERLDTFDQMIQMIAAPYARGGDDPKYSKLMHGWNRMYGIASSWIIMTETHFTENDVTDEQTDSKTLSDNTIVVNDLHRSLVHHIFPDGKDVLDYCFKDADVQPMAVTVVQSMMPLGGMGAQIDVNKNTEGLAST
jgi:hypothetical protein